MCNGCGTYECPPLPRQASTTTVHDVLLDCSRQNDQNSLAGTITLPADFRPSILGGEDGKQHSWAPPEPRVELLWCGVDLDGTLAEGVWTPGCDGRQIGAPIERNLRKYHELRQAGYKTVIWTARSWEFYETVESWLNYHGILFDKIECGKLLVAAVIDDRAIESEMPNWLPATQQARQWWNRNGAWVDKP